MAVVDDDDGARLRSLAEIIRSLVADYSRKTGYTVESIQVESVDTFCASGLGIKVHARKCDAASGTDYQLTVKVSG